LDLLSTIKMKWLNERIYEKNISNIFIDFNEHVYYARGTFL
jgi:hypothetical protein